MRTLTATEIRHKFGEVVEGLKTEPVLVEKSGRPVAVILAYETYERLQELEDAWWGEQANQAMAEGLLSAKATTSWLKEKLDAAPPQ